MLTSTLDATSALYTLPTLPIEKAKIDITDRQSFSILLT